MFGDIFEKKIRILFFIIYLINSFFYNILNYLIIDKFSPTHSAIAYIFENFGIFIINTIICRFLKELNEKCEIDYKFGIRLVMYILLIIASFIFNEFLVINICGLANNTKLFLDYREKIELDLINEKDGLIIRNDSISEDNNQENNRNSLVSRSISKIELNEL